MNYTTIALIVNVLFVLILLAGFLVGFWRGLKKSAVNVAFAFAAALLAFFITIPVTNAILGISIGGNSIKDTLLNMILGQESIKNLVQSVPNLQTLIAGIPAAIAGTIVFIILTCLAEGVFYILYKIVALIFLRNKKPAEDGADQKKPKKYRLLGGAVGLVKTFVVLVFAFLPLTALTGLFQDLTKENDYFKETQVEATLADTEEQEGNKSSNILVQNLPQIALDGVRAFDNSAFGIFGGVAGLDNAVFDYFANVQIGEQKVYIRREIKTYWNAVDLYTCISNANGKKLNQLDFEKIEGVKDGILESGIYNTVVTDLLAEVFKNPDSILPAETIDQFGDVFEAVKLDLEKDGIDKSEYFSHDINAIYDTFELLASSGVIDEINTIENAEITDYLDVLSNHETELKGTLSNLFSTNIVRAAAKPVVKLALGGLIDEIDHIAANTADWENEDWTEVSNNLATALTYAQNLMAEVDLTAVLQEPLTLLQQQEDESYYDLPKIFENLGGLVDTLRSNKLFVNSEGKPIVDTMLEGNFELPTTSVIGSDGNVIHFEDPTLKNPYTALFTNVFAEPMTKIQQSGLYELIQDSSSVDQIALFKLVANQGETFLSDVILPLTQVEPTRSLLVDDLFKQMSGSKIKFDLLETYDDWDNDLAQIGKLVTTLGNIELDGGQTAIDAMMQQSSDVSSLLLALCNEKNMGLSNNNENGAYLTGGTISKIIMPILHAKSTSGFADDIYTILKNTLSTLIGGTSIDISYLSEDYQGADDQSQEIADIFENFIAVYNSYKVGGKTKLEEVPFDKLGMLLNSLKVNTYRNKVETTKREGAFASVFPALINYLKTIPAASIALRDIDPATDLSDIDFVPICELIENALKLLEG